MKPLLQAEQAVLGAVLLDPGQLDRLGWLEPAHFYRPHHRALFAAMRQLHTAGKPVVGADGGVPLAWLSDVVAEAGQHVRGLTTVYAHTLVTVCPRPEHSPAYGRMVLDGAIHRTVTQHAVRLHQIARADTLHGDVSNTLHHAEVMAEVLNTLARRWGAEPRPTAAPPQVLPTNPSPAEAQTIADNERLLLAALTDQPTTIDTVGWLRPGDFAVPAHGQLYRCLTALHHRSEPIDPLTLLWEAQRRGLLADGTVTDEQITAICSGAGPGSTEWLGEQVTRSALLRTAAASARTIRDLAAIDALPPGRLINQALAALGALDDIRQRWTTGTHPPDPPPQSGGPSTGPPPGQVRAARARSTPPTTPSQPTAAGSPPPTPARPSARSHT
jgi:replicative DNA helicase